mgnify:CR=1 FL=1
MKNIIVKVLGLVTCLILLGSQVSCDNNEYLDSYSKHVGVIFPNDLELIYKENKSGFQDTSNLFVYKLTGAQLNELSNQIVNNICNDTSRTSNCWKINEGLYHFKYLSKPNPKDYSIEVTILESNGIITMTIYESQL